MVLDLSDYLCVCAKTSPILQGRCLILLYVEHALLKHMPLLLLSVSLILSTLLRIAKTFVGTLTRPLCVAIFLVV